MEFLALHDKRSQTTSLLLSAFIALIYIFLIRHLNEAGNVYQKFAFLAVFIIIVAIPYALSVRRYEIAGDDLLIKFLAHSKRIPLESMVMVSHLADDNLNQFGRVMGSFGYFGYSGRYKSKKYGSITVFANRTDDLILIDSGDRKFIVAPHDSGKFYSMLRNIIRSQDQYHDKSE